MHTHALFLDIGRVVAQFDHAKSCGWIAGETGHSPEWVRKQLFSPRGPAIRHEEGMSSQQFFEEVCSLTNLRTSYDTFFSMWGNIFSESQDIRRILGNVSTHVTIGLISNTDPIHWEFISKLPVIKEFFPQHLHVTTSFEVRARKPNTAIYHHALTAIGISPDRAVYIDDVPDYVQTFRKLGGKAEVYNCEEHPPARLERILRSYNFIQ